MLSNPQSLIPSPWLPNGGLPAGTSVATGQGMLPVYDTSGIADALFVGTYYSDTSLLTSCTSVDGTVTYSYDATGQLIAAQYSPLPPGEGQGEGIQANESYTYDANGNRVTANGYVYTTGDGNLLLSDGTYWYTYDAEGNRTARFVDADASGTLTTGDTEVTQYAWDARNRLVKVTDYATYGGSPTQIVDYFYDLENRWIGEDIDSNGDGVVDHETRFVYDGNQIIFQFDKDGAGEVTSADLSHRYLWGPAVDQVLADEQFSALPPEEGEGFDVTTPGNVVWPLTDHLGTVLDLVVYDSETDVTSVADHRVYDSFGTLLSETNAAVDCLFGFTGRATDSATGLRNHANRWSDPRTGDWMSEDPIGFSGGDANTRRYCDNSPTTTTDPTGLRIVRCAHLVMGFFDGPRSETQWFWVPDSFTADPSGAFMGRYSQEATITADQAVLLDFAKGDAACEKELVRLLNVAEHLPECLNYNSHGDFVSAKPNAGIDTCHRYGQPICSKLLDERFKQIGVTGGDVDYPAFGGLTTVHYVITVTLHRTDGKTLTFYMDQGYWGGSDHIFFALPEGVTSK